MALPYEASASTFAKATEDAKRLEIKCWRDN